MIRAMMLGVFVLLSVADSAVAQTHRYRTNDGGYWEWDASRSVYIKIAPPAESPKAPIVSYSFNKAYYTQIPLGEGAFTITYDDHGEKKRDTNCTELRMVIGTNCLSYLTGGRRVVLGPGIEWRAEEVKEPDPPSPDDIQDAVSIDDRITEIEKSIAALFKMNSDNLTHWSKLHQMHGNRISDLSRENGAIIRAIETISKLEQIKSDFDKAQIESQK